MNKRSANLAVVRLRRLLLAVLLLFVSLLAGLYLFGRAGRDEDRRRPPAADETPRGLMRGQGFQFAVTQEDQTLFEVRSERIVTESEDRVVLEQLGVTLVREDNERYELHSLSGTYDPSTQDTILRGEVVVDGPNGLRLKADGLTMRQGEIVRSSSPVRFLIGNFTGRADLLTLNLKENLHILRGRVFIETRPGAESPASLRCDRLVFERDQGLVRALGNVQLRRGDDLLRARRMSVHLSEDESEVRFVRLQWGVSGRLPRPTAEGWRRTLSFRGLALSVAFDPERRAPRQVELEGRLRKSAFVELSDETGAAQRLESPYLLGELGDAGLEIVEAFEPVKLAEFLVFAEDVRLREGCAERAVAEFNAAGQMVGIALDRQVDLWERGLQLLGDHARSQERAMELRGEPARVLRAEGELQAPRIVREAGSGDIRALDGVQAVYGEGEGVSIVGARGPVELESERALLRQSPRAVVFEGSVRAWQGGNLLLTEELEDLPGEERLTARGGVKTILQDDRNGSPARTPSGGPVEVTADSLVYERALGQILYSGGARAHQGERRIRCEEIELTLGNEGRIETLDCRGGARIEDRQSGKTVLGDSAVYDLGSDKVTVTGERVVLRDREGREIEGPRLIYDFATGAARIESRGVFEPAAER